MNRTELIKAVAAQSKLNQKQAAVAVENIFSIIADTVAAGESVSVLGFGTFEKKHREARLGHNPLTGEAVTVAACDYPSFKAGRAFKEKVKG